MHVQPAQRWDIERSLGYKQSVCGENDDIWRISSQPLHHLGFPSPLRLLHGQTKLARGHGDRRRAKLATAAGRAVRLGVHCQKLVPGL